MAEVTDRLRQVCCGGSLQASRRPLVLLPMLALGLPTVIPGVRLRRAEGQGREELTQAQAQTEGSSMVGALRQRQTQTRV